MQSSSAGVVSYLTWYSKAEVRRIVGRLKEVMEGAAVEITCYKHADVTSALPRRMRRTEFTGVARRAGRDITGRDSPRRRAVVERALELRSGDDVDVT